MPPPREIMDVLVPPIGLVVILGPLCLAIVVLLIIDIIDRMQPEPQPPPENEPPARIYAGRPTPIWRFYAPREHKPRRGRMTSQQ
jgi:hypothetical protein